MKLPGMTSSAETLQETFGVYHLARLKADKGMKDLAEAFEKAQGRLKVRIEAHKTASMAAQIAMAARDGDDAAFDDAVRRFALAVLATVGNRKSAPPYLKYFPEGLNAVVSAPLESELQKAGVIITKLAEDEDETLKGHAGVLTEAMNTLSASMDAHRAALDSEVQAYGLLQTEKVNWLDAYKRSYRDITRLYFKEPQRAETFFKAAPKAKKGEVATPPAPPSAGIV